MTCQPTRAASAANCLEGERFQKIGLNTIPQDIHYLIFSELANIAPSTLLDVLRVSKTLHEAALPFVYRHLYLSKGSAYRNLINRFLDTSTCDIAKHVRRITVKDKISERDLTKILEKIEDHGILHELHWNTAAHIHDSILEKLQTTWPGLQISVTVPNRADAVHPAYRYMDLRLLSSPLLARLEYVISHSDMNGAVTRSEWPRLSQALLNSKNIRSLTIYRQQSKTRDSRYHVEPVIDTQTTEPARLDLSLGLRFPKLESLSIRDDPYHNQGYQWDRDHCLGLLNAIDPSCLRELDFAEQYPETFFTTFTDQVPDIKVLRFGATRRNRIGPVKNFINSLSALESLYIGEARGCLNKLLPVITKHRDTLKTLILGPTWDPYYTPQHIDRNVLENIAETFPKLEHLGWHLPYESSTDEDLLTVFSSMNLRTLDLYIDLFDGATEYSAELKVDAWGSNCPPLNRSKATVSATKIANSISRKQSCPLDRLTLNIARRVYQDRAQADMVLTALQLRRDERAIEDGQVYHVRGRMNWYAVQPLEEELLFREER